MSKIKSLLAKETVTTVEFPEIDGFMVDLVYLNRDELMKIRNRSLNNHETSWTNHEKS